MKIRQGFVSNSSSSSFVAIVSEIDIEDITSEMIKEKDIFAIGTDMWEGTDLIHIDSEELLKFFKLFPSYKCDSCYGDDIEEGEFGFYIHQANGSFKKEDLEDGVSYSLLDLTVDHASSETLEKLFNKYTNNETTEELAEELLNKLYREKKIERILKDED
jgi:hypothetical protein